MRIDVVFKIISLLTMLFFISIYTSGQTNLPFSYDGGNPGTTISGLSQLGLGADYSTSPRIKFDTTGDYLIMNFNGVPGILSFKIEWNQGSIASRFPGTFTLKESPNGVTYSLVQLYDISNGSALTNTVTASELFAKLLTTSHFLKWIYTSKSNGNIGIGAINLTAGINSVLNISTNVLLGLTYLVNNGPSKELSFNVSGSALTNNIIIKSPIDYEISLGKGASFNALNMITLAQTNGIVVNSTIYSRLKKGLIVGGYKENILISTDGAITDTISCDGNVTAKPTITLTDISDPTFIAKQGIAVDQSLSLSGVNLNADLGLTISGNDAGLFSLSQYSVPQTGGVLLNTILKIMYKPIFATSTNTATLTMSSLGAMPVIRNLIGNTLIATDISITDTPLEVFVNNGKVIFNAKTDEIVEIYNSVGQKLIQKLTIGGINTIPVSTRGVLLVKMGSRISKVIM